MCRMLWKKRLKVITTVIEVVVFGDINSKKDKDACSIENVSDIRKSAEYSSFIEKDLAQVMNSRQTRTLSLSCTWLSDLDQVTVK